MSYDTTSEFPVHYDLLFTDAVKFELYIGTPKLKCTALHPALKAFQKNIERFAQMAALPSSVVDASMRHLLMLCQATFNVLKKPVMDDTEVRVNADKISKEYEKVAERHWAADGGFFDGRNLMLHIFESDVLYFNKREKIHHPLGNWEGYYALLSAQVIAAWTALETLIEDVWVTAVNLHPEHAQVLDGKQFTLERLQEHNYNWEGRVGELLAEKMEFGHLDKTIIAYRKIFPKREKIHEALAGKALAAVHAVRNTLVHDAGIVRGRFKKTFPSPWNKVVDGQRLRLTGKNVAELTTTITRTGNLLLLQIDEWLHKPDKPTPKPPSPTG
jgi:hypothetical protein